MSVPQVSVCRPSTVTVYTKSLLESMLAVKNEYRVNELSDFWLCRNVNQNKVFPTQSVKHSGVRVGMTTSYGLRVRLSQSHNTRSCLLHFIFGNLVNSPMKVSSIAVVMYNKQ